MAYVDFEAYAAASASPVDGEAFARLSPIADLIIDDWTLGRVGKAVRNGEDLPQPVITAYVGTVDALPAIVSETTGAGDEVASFSNGVDSFTFVTGTTASSRLRARAGWLFELLPVEWCSAVASFEGGNAYAG